MSESDSDLFTGDYATDDLGVAYPGLEGLVRLEKGIVCFCGMAFIEVPTC